MQGWIRRAAALLAWPFARSLERLPRAIAVVALLSLQALLSAPALAAQVCTLTITFTNTGANSYRYDFSSVDYTNCDPGGIGGIYTDASVGTGQRPTAHGTMETDLTVFPIDTVVYRPSPLGYVGGDSGVLYDINGNTIAVNITMNSGAPTANAVSATVAHGSSANAITLNVTGAAATSVAVGTQASHGTATASGTTISYTPNSSYSGADSFTYTATGSGGTSAPATVTITVSNATVTYSPSSPLAGGVGSAYSQSIGGASGATAPYTYALASGSLPAGLVLASNGTLSGTPTAGGSFNFTVTATDSSTGTGPFSATSGTLTLTVAAPTIAVNPGSLSNATAGSAYSASVTGSGGTAPYSLAVTVGSLPAGLTLASNGALSGTPTASGTFNFTVTATDSSTGTGPYTGSRPYSLIVDAPTVTVSPASLTSATVGASTNQTVTASGGVAPYTYAVTAGSLPAGLTLSSSGTLSGTPTAGGTFNFTVTATDSSTGTGPAAGSKAYSLTVAAPTVTVAPVSLTAATVGGSTNQTVTANGGVGPYTYAVTAGSLPAGLSLSSGGVISGTPTAGGSFNFTVTATDSSTGTGAPFTGSRAYSLTVNSPAISVAPASLSAVAAGAAVNGTLTASGGTSGYTYAVTAGSLPPGVSVSSAGVLSGAATATGTYNFTVTATDSSTGAGPFTGSRAYSWTVNPPMLTISPASGSNLSGSALSGYSQAFTPSGGTAPYTYAILINSGSMPAGLSFSTATGVLSGTPTAGGTVTFTVTATDATTGAGSPFHVSGTYNLTMGAPTVTVLPMGSLTTPAIGTAYSQTFTASGGAAPYGYVVSAGTLPAGLTLSAAGVLSGTPTAAGNFNFTVQATDANNFAGTRAYSVTIGGPTLAIGTASLPNGNVGVAYSQTVSASAGTAPYSFAVTAGALPAGLSLNGATGAIAGTPTTANTYNFTVTATDSTTGTGAPYTVAKAYTVVIGVQAPVANASSASTPYDNPVQINLAPAITGGAAVSIAVATPPAHGTATVAGLTVTYTPAAGYAGSDSFTYTATNAGGTSAAATVTVMVSAPTLTLQPNQPNLPNGQVGAAYSQAVSTSGGTAPYSYSVSAGSLPSGLSLDGSTGMLAGKPTAAGAFSFTIRATDSTSGMAASGMQAYSLTITPALPVAGSKSVTVPFNAATQIDLAGAVNGGPATTFTLTVQPSHGTATLNGTTVTYTPASGYFGNDSFSYTAGNVSGTSPAAAVTITVNPPPPVPQPVTVTVPSGSAGGGNSTEIPLVISGGPVSSITILTPPQHGTLTIVGLEASSNARAKALAAGRTDTAATVPAVIYTPNPGYYGTDSFSYTASNAAGTSVAATVTIIVSAPPPTLAVVSATTKSGQPVTLAVTANAVGGPFTELSIVTPPGHGKAVVQGMAIVYTSLATFSGTDTVVYALSNAHGSTQGTATITVAGRLDPSKDAEVSGLLSAQADATRRFASSQLNNFSRRLESLHGDGWAKSSFGLSLSSYGVDSVLPTDPIAQMNASAALRNGEAGRPAGAGMAARRGPGATLAHSGAQNVAPDDASRAAGRDTPQAARSELSWWVGGSVDFGHRDQLTGTSRFRFHTDGVSLGADYRVSQLWSIGLGGGFSSDRSDVGSKGSKSTSNSSVLAVYAALRPAPDTFVDAVLGHSTLSFDLNRFITDEGGFATGQRRGRQWFGSLAAGYEYRERQGLLLSAYARLELMRATLNGYAESAADVNSLTYHDQSVRMSTGKLGLRAETAYALGGNELQPRARIEYQHRFEGADQATMSYTDLGSNAPLYTAQPLGARRGQWMAEVGGKWVLRSGFALSLDYGSSVAGGGGTVHTVRLGAEGRF
ncbi:MAG TPA: putative Ig domain-containing protein [Roseateles sp.]|uniref:putative Ig domain-containing protein n=1 Tax=Roseateles sp. TaxID=1971397 RepID=UPI002ED880C7